MDTLNKLIDVIGTNIKILRSLRGYTQIELATRAGVTREYIWALETHRHQREPKLQTLVRVADALGVSFGRFCTPIEVPKDHV